MGPRPRYKNLQAFRATTTSLALRGGRLDAFFRATSAEIRDFRGWPGGSDPEHRGSPVAGYHPARVHVRHVRGPVRPHSGDRSRGALVPAPIQREVHVSRRSPFAGCGGRFLRRPPAGALPAFLRLPRDAPLRLPGKDRAPGGPMFRIWAGNLREVDGVCAARGGEAGSAGRQARVPIRGGPGR